MIIMSSSVTSTVVTAATSTSKVIVSASIATISMKTTATSAKPSPGLIELASAATSSAIKIISSTHVVTRCFASLGSSITFRGYIITYVITQGVPFTRWYTEDIPICPPMSFVAVISFAPTRLTDSSPCRPRRVSW